MIGVTLKGLAGRKLRAVLTALAVVIGISMVSGSYVLTDTIQKAFDGIFGESYAGTDAVIAGKQLVDSSTSGRATVPADLLAEVKALPGVEAAAGAIFDLQSNSNPARLVDESGKTIGWDGGAPTMGVGLDASQPRFSALSLVEGTWAHGADQVVIDANTASEHGFRVGDTIGVAALGPTRQYTITGIAEFGSADSIGAATIAVFDVATAQALYDKEGRFDGISVAAKDGVTPQQLVREIQPLLPPQAAVQTGDAQAAADSKETNDGISFITYFLLGFGAIALFVGAFVIFNTLSITVAQRTREFATLRTLGASRRQVLRSVVLEGLVIGLVASMLGLALGLGLAKTLHALFVAVGIDLPQAGTVIASRTIAVSLFLGTLVTVLASLVPALRATRVPPISAVREGATPAESRFTRAVPYMGLAMIALATAAIAAGLFGDSMGTADLLVLFGLGAVALLIGIALLASRLVKPLAALLGWPARRIAGGAGRLAHKNAVRNPARTASTAAALMIGLTLVTVVAVLGASLRHSADVAIETQIHANYVLTSRDGFDPFSPAASEAAASASRVQSASDVRFDRARVAGTEVDVTGIDPITIGAFYNYEWVQGSDLDIKQLGDNDAVVVDDFAKEHDLKVGSALPIQTASGEQIRLTVQGIYDPPELAAVLGPVTIRQDTFDRSFPRPRNGFTFLNTLHRETAAATTALEAALTGFPDTKLHTESSFVSSRTATFALLLKVLYVLLAFSVIVSLFGMINTLVLSVHERTREIGMLRAVGMTRQQARRMIRHESIITALIGATLGLLLGASLAGLVTRALSAYDVTFTLPVGTLALFACVAIGAGILAALLPARRASRLNVLDALQYE
jgi:putative ABC transport system permease protein